MASVPESQLTILIVLRHRLPVLLFFFFQAEDGIRDLTVTGVQTCALPISHSPRLPRTVARGERAAAPDGSSSDRRSGRSDQRPRAPAIAAVGAWDPRRQIGRASCRERV